MFACSAENARADVEWLHLKWKKRFVCTWVHWICDLSHYSCNFRRKVACVGGTMNGRITWKSRIYISLETACYGKIICVHRKLVSVAQLQTLNDSIFLCKAKYSVVYLDRRGRKTFRVCSSCIRLNRCKIADINHFIQHTYRVWMSQRVFFYWEFLRVSSALWFNSRFNDIFHRDIDW